MNNQIHTVLGASGAIGYAVIKELKNRNLTIRAVERTAGLKDIETVEANLLNEAETIKSVQFSSFVYLCIGLPYQSKVWQTDWPLLMRNVIMACEKTNAKLIFLDNAYMYSQPLTIPFKENHPQKPTTKKGLIRKQTTDLLLTAINERKVQAVIGRSSDFYGDYSVNSPFYISFLQNMLKGKAPQVLGKKGITHTYANTEDNGKALVALALDETTYGDVWHLPVGKPITFDEINEMMNKELGTNFELSYVPKFMRKILSFFIPPLKDVEEMLYQFENPYEMNYDKFKNHFPDFTITAYNEGIKKMIQSFKK